MAISRYALASRVMAVLAISSSIAMVTRLSGDYLVLVTGVLGLTAGNYYMWRVRYVTSRVRTGILLLLLVVLLFYLGQEMVFSWTRDPLLLARYLIYGLIVSSFDLRTQRNVLGNMVLAGLLFMLLSHMAFNVWFPILIGLYALFAAASAVLGHMENETSRSEVVGNGSWSAAAVTWASFTLVFLVITVAVFALMPRFGIGAPNRAAFLPSWIDLSQGGGGQIPSLPSAGVSPDILVTQQTGSTDSEGHVELGYTGPGGDAAVMHVRSRIPSYWRGAVLTEYDRVGWLPAVSRVSLINEATNEFVVPDSELRGVSSSWHSQTFYILVDQPNAVFTGYKPGRLYLPDSSQVSLARGTVYRAVSPQPRLNPARLRLDRVDTTDAVNLQPPEVTERVSELARTIVAGATSDYDKVARLEEFFRTNYTYDLGVGSLTVGKDPVDVFLFERQSGYCAQFATAMAVMARDLGIPARIAVGYLPGRYDALSGTYTVRAGDAHAWVEVNFAAAGWVPFDPTPRPELANGISGPQGWLSFGLTDYIDFGFLGASDITEGFSIGQVKMPGTALLALLGVVAVATAVVTAWFMWRGRRTTYAAVFGYTSLTGAARKEVLTSYRKMASLLVKKGLPRRQPSQTPREYAAAIAPRLAGGAELVQRLSDAAANAAYDPSPLDPHVATEASDTYGTLLRTLSVRPV